MTTEKKAAVDHPIHELIAGRWSPCAFSDRPVPDGDLRSLFEAARWAASAYNEQPWGYLVATKANPEEHERMLSCLVDGNQVWAKKAPVLAIGCVRTHFAHNGKPNNYASHDLGQANATLALEAAARGLFVHPMAGILPDKIHESYEIPEGVTPLVGLAIGYLGDASELPDGYRERDLAPRQRKPLADFVFGGRWGAVSEVV